MSDSWAMFVALLVVGAGIAVASIYFPELSKEVVIGIDLGTTYSVVAVCVGGIVNVIEDPASGSGLLPSYVAFPPSSSASAKPLVGQAAKDVANQFPEDTLFDIKRIIGRKFSDPVVQEEIRNFPFKVGPSQDEIPLPIVTVKKASSKPLQLYPTNVSSFVLGKLKKQIEDYFFWRQLMGWKIRAATISVPANFDVQQQLATLEAARQAGFNNVQLISEPAAAALAFRLHQRPGVRHVLVFDFGGGTLDVALLVLDQKTFSVMTSSGDSHLGGEDVDRCILQHFEREFKAQNGMELPPESVEVQGALRRQAEAVKIELSNVTRVQRVLKDVYKGKDLQVDFSRKQFETVCGDLFARAMAPVEEVLSVAGMAKEDIGDVVLVGGSSRIPRVRELLTQLFDGATLNTEINPDEAVARGATLTRTCK